MWRYSDTPARQERRIKSEESSAVGTAKKHKLPPPAPLVADEHHRAKLSRQWRSRGGGGRCPDCQTKFVRHEELSRHYNQATRVNPRLGYCAGLRSRGISFEEFVRLARVAQYGARSRSNSIDAGGAASSFAAPASKEEEEEEDLVDDATSLEDSMADGSHHQFQASGEHGGTGVDEADQPSWASENEDKATEKEEEEDEKEREREEVCYNGDSYDEYLPFGEFDVDPESDIGREDESFGGDDVYAGGDVPAPVVEDGISEGISPHDGGEQDEEVAGELPVTGVSQNPSPLDSELPNEDDAAWLHNIHRIVGERLGGSVVDGGKGKVKRQFGEKADQYYRPFKHYTELGLMVFAVKHQISQAALTDLFAILHYKDGEPGDGEGEGRGFNTADVPSTGKGFVARMREYLPLFEVWARKVQCKPSTKKKNPGGPTTADVYDIPKTHVMAFLLKSKTAMEEMLDNPGGVVLDREGGASIGLASEHVFSLPTKPRGGRRRNAMHGTLVRSMPHLNTDGFLGAAYTRLYVGDLVMCDLKEEGEGDPPQVPCRIVRSVVDEELRTLVVTVRRFRNAYEVLGIDHENAAFFTAGTLVRVWEELGADSEVVLRDPRQALDLIEVFNRADVTDQAHTRPWQGEGQRRDGWSFFGEGFVERKGNKFQIKKKRNDQGWRREVNHNYLKLKYISLLFGLWVDDFNVWRLANPVKGEANVLDGIIVP